MDFVKLIVTAFLILLATKLQLFSERLSALLIALPLVSVIAMSWMHLSGESPTRLANHSEGTFWFVLPTLPMFLVIPWLLRHGWEYWQALGLSCALTVLLFWAMVVFLRNFGIDLMPK